MTSTVLFSVLTLVKVPKIFFERAFLPPLISPPKSRKTGQTWIGSRPWIHLDFDVESVGRQKDVETVLDGELHGRIRVRVDHVSSAFFQFL